MYHNITYLFGLMNRLGQDGFGQDMICYERLYKVWEGVGMLLQLWLGQVWLDFERFYGVGQVWLGFESSVEANCDGLTDW